MMKGAKEMKRSANATRIGALTVYHWTKGPTLSIECWSTPSGTTLTFHITSRRSFEIRTNFGATKRYTTRISARRYYRKGN